MITASSSSAISTSRPRDDEDLTALVDNPGSTCPSPLSSTVLAGLFEPKDAPAFDFAKLR